MSKGDFIALIIPAIAFAIAIAFLILWNYRREKGYIALLSAAFLTLAFSFTVRLAINIYDWAALKLIVNALIPISGYLLIQGALSRYRLKPPLVAIGLVCTVGLGAFAWYLFGDPDITARIYAMNFMAGTLILLLGVKLLKARDKRPIDQALIGFILLWGIQSFVRTIVVVGYEGPYLDAARIYSTLYWITLTVSIAIFLLLFAVLLIAAIALDIAEALKAESYLDPLSGLLNRRGLDNMVGAHIEAGHAFGMPLSIVLCDLDSFKYVNDTYGHMTGDRAIRSFADCLRNQLSEQHLCARIGGEEFAIVLPSSTSGAARLFAESARTAYSNCAVEGIPPATHLSASFGVAELRAGEDFLALMRRADAALYRAKQEGRDRVTVAPPELSLCATPSGQDLSSAAPSRTAATGVVNSR